MLDSLKRIVAVTSLLLTALYVGIVEPLATDLSYFGCGGLPVDLHKELLRLGGRIAGITEQDLKPHSEKQVQGWLNLMNLMSQWVRSEE